MDEIETKNILITETFGFKKAYSVSYKTDWWIINEIPKTLGMGHLSEDMEFHKNSNWQDWAIANIHENTKFIIEILKPCVVLHDEYYREVKEDMFVFEYNNFEELQLAKFNAIVKYCELIKENRNAK